ncbi:MAG: Glycosyltransferase [candidate division WS6 bacterium GW2011_GWC1_36_11]|uniref:Glycosyltransferase n=1 Tax=candidate division WS6 bacterium GW2011_GWC1_36_11 TaxID=1619090 RepID=A0A0G0DB60_9BACT|nr:MAG: Glycosyltransferase [candidate division WS6 bacterium GW2011_GWC1_36_11]HAM96527.1 hypothetical protein [Patescibacteria group bacterium]
MKNKNLPKAKYDLINISHYFSPRVGGLENMAHSLLLGLKNYDLKILSVFGSAKRYSTDVEGFETESFRTLDLFDKTYPIFGLDFVRYLLNIIATNPEAKIVIHSRHLTSSLIASLVCRLSNHPYVVIEHNAGPSYFNSALITQIIAWADQNIFGSVLRNAEHIFAVSESGKKWIAKNFRISSSQISVIYNGYTKNGFPNLYGKKEDIVLWASKWIKVKDPQTALKAYMKLAPRYKDWKFLLIGEGRNLQYDTEDLPSNLQIIPELLKQEDLFRLIQKSKVYVNTSLSEGLALGVIEAVSFGLIPVLSDASSNKEIAKQIGTLEYIFGKKNASDLARNIQKAIIKSKNTQYVQDIVRRNKDAFSMDKMIEEYFKKLLPHHYRNTKINTLSIVMPVYNEERTIIKILTKVKNLKLPNDINKEIIIVNDASTDESMSKIEDFFSDCEELKKYNCSVKLLANEKNRGKSQTIKKGILNSTGELVVIQDADLEYDPNDFKIFISNFLDDPYLDVIYGNRFTSTNKMFNAVHNIGNRFISSFSSLFTRIYGFTPKDMETCYKMGRGELFRTIFKTLESETNFGLEPEITAKLARYRTMRGKRLKFMQLPVAYVPRSLALGKKMRWLKNGFEALFEIMYFNTTPMKIEEVVDGKNIKRVI